MLDILYWLYNWRRYYWCIKFFHKRLL